MFYYRALIRHAPPLEPPGGAIEEFTTKAIDAVLRRQVAVPTQSALRYPHEQALMENLRAEIAGVPPELIPRACDTLLTPQVVVPTEEPEQFQDEVRRRATLLSLGVDAHATPYAVAIAI